MDYLLVSRDGLEKEFMFPGYVGYQNCDVHDFAGNNPRYKPLGYKKYLFSRSIQLGIYYYHCLHSSHT